MATCFDNLVKHLEFAIRQLEELQHRDLIEEETDKAYELLFKLEDLFEHVFEQ